jgi:pimeloyl-ACP methyl ester carboxylesterase
VDESGGLAFSESGVQAGDELPLLFIHGAGGNRYFWPPQLRRLAGYPVYALDLPGHGQSPGPAEGSIKGYLDRIRDGMSAVGLKPALWVGHSMGGAIALTAALTNPADVAGLVLIGTGARLRVSPQLLAMIADEIQWERALDLITEWSFSNRADRRLVELARQRMADVNRKVLGADFSACDAFDVMVDLDKIQVPTLVICGREDRMTPMKYSRFLAEAIGGAELRLVDGAGHMVMLEQPAAVAAAITEFLDNHF